MKFANPQTLRYLALALILLTVSCQNSSQDKRMKGQANQLINQTSPYLLQHAYNPVDWMPWGNEALDLAQAEDKLIIVSIGYASCHWCHVMEEESFEDQQVAQVMNDNFISIKVDREERPDIDHIYMDAVQLMTGSGGWPLNAICLPDGRPIFGGTYFPKETWMENLKQLQQLYKDDPAQAIEYADKLQKGIEVKNQIIKSKEETTANLDQIEEIVKKWSQNFDTINGGFKSQTKFPIPINQEFLMRYAFQSDKKEIQKFNKLSLDKMALGGIYDHVDGGFSRYSVDPTWHIPHFEKMLYDNAQLISLYSNAYSLYGNSLYKSVVEGTYEFLETQLKDQTTQAYFSSLDADSKNKQGHLEEGAYYTFTEQEIDSVIKDSPELFKELYQVNQNGYWEDGQYQLTQKQAIPEFAKNHNRSEQEINQLVKRWRKGLKNLRKQRSKPRLDDKILGSWNALAIQGLSQAYKSFGDEKFKTSALKTGEFIANSLIREDGGLMRNYKNGTANINAYLEDYAMVIESFISLYEISLDERWIKQAKELTDYSLDHFYDDNSGMFFFTSNLDQELIHRKIESEDNVIPSSNSTMANNLYKLSLIYGNRHYKKVSTQMLSTMLPISESYGGAYANWLNLALNHVGTYYEIAISGPTAIDKQHKLFRQYIPNALRIAAIDKSDIPVMLDRYDAVDTYIFVCIEGTCKLPVETSEEAYQDLNFSLK
ncbi:MAG: thioredoxin domain-containing protein [Flavobacteriaceae bacterium]